MSYAAAVHGRMLKTDLEAYEEILLARKRTIEIYSGIKFLPAPRGKTIHPKSIDEFSPIAVDYAELFLYNCPEITRLEKLNLIFPVWSSFTEKYLMWRWPKEKIEYFEWLQKQNLVVGSVPVFDDYDSMHCSALDLFLKEATFAITMAALSTDAGLFKNGDKRGFYSVMDDEYSTFQKITTSKIPTIKLNWHISPENLATYIPSPRTYL